MSEFRVLVLFDTPSIKQFVFGTDALREIRGASAMLDQLNRTDTERELRKSLPSGATLDRVYANGGAAQFVLRHCNEAEARHACESVVGHFINETAGDVHPVYGVAQCGNDQTYQAAMTEAHFELRSRREILTIRHAPQLMPLVAECTSASHLPATGLFAIGDDQARLLSESSRRKEVRGRVAREHGMWAEWMEHLASLGPWPEADQWDELRCNSVVEIGQRGGLESYIGLVYADGNAMGRIVQNLDSQDTCRVFSDTVDGSIRKACFAALDKVCQREIGAIRAAVGSADKLRPLPADILLLGGDDLLVVVPADRSIDFAAAASQEFQRLTTIELKAVTATGVREFFSRHVGDSGFTISSGVAIARSSYPFYLLLDLAEDLLKNAKRRGSDVAQDGAPTAPEAYVDFHVVAGSNSFRLGQLRKDDYHVDSAAPRTLRPMSLNHLKTLRDSISALRSVNFPRSKLHALHEASLMQSTEQAERAIRDIFGRCKFSAERNERRMLWQAVESLLPPNWSFNFPWFERDGKRVLAVADIVEASDLFDEL
ncbi:MAG: hypothetical protein WD049_05515 [Candidatus Paceibacterota bacterium]